MSYYTLKESYTSGKFIDQHPVDDFPFYNKWRNNPLSDHSIIRANVAGYYPYNRRMVQEIPKPVPVPEVTYPEELILAKDYSITYPPTTLISRSIELSKANMINTQP
jgi:hypothetical protein